MAKIDEVKEQVIIGKPNGSRTGPGGPDEGSAAKDILQAMIDGMKVVGTGFPPAKSTCEMLIAAKAMAKRRSADLLGGEASTSWAPASSAPSRATCTTSGRISST